MITEQLFLENARSIFATHSHHSTNICKSFLTEIFSPTVSYGLYLRISRVTE